jgi:dihydroorotate dehydrogenase (NAD+) catalytic subunit
VISVEADLSVKFLGLKLSHPILNASGILGHMPEHVTILKSYGVAAIVSKTFTPEPRTGHKEPVIIELPTGGIINSMGLPNPGITGLKKFVDTAKKISIPIIISVGGRNPDEFHKVAIAAEEAGADAVELNLSCPHTKDYGLELGADPQMAYEVTKEASYSIKVPTIAKLGLIDKMIEVSGKVLEAGAKALTLINTIKSMFIDVYTARPFLNKIYGGLSGPSIHPIAVRVVYDVYREHEDTPIIASGGVVNWYDAAEFFLVGSRAVQIGYALLLKKDRAVPELLNGLSNWLAELKYKNLEEVIGLAARK